MVHTATPVHSTMGKEAARRWHALWLVWVVVAWAALPSLAQRLIWLGTLGGNESIALGVSADGSVVVGSARNAAGQKRAFRWTAARGMQDLGTLGGDSSWALGVSPDGSVVVGWAENAKGQQRAFRWTAARGMQDLGTLYGYSSMAYGVSADGSVVVGETWNAAGHKRAFRWTAARGMQDLGTLGGSGSGAYGVSADGSVVVGSARNAAGQWRAFRWTAARGMQNLGTLGGGDSEAWGVSADGSVVVGYAYNTAGLPRAFRWTAAGGMEDLNIAYAHLLTNGSMFGAAFAISPDGRYIAGQGYNAATGRVEAFLLDTRRTGVEGRLTWLGTLGGDESIATGVSADGSVVVGRAENAEGWSRAFRWTAAGGMEDLNITYASLLTNGSMFGAALAISPDGRYIVGGGYNAATGRLEAFLLDTRRTWR